MANLHENLFASVGWHPGDITLENKVGDISPTFEKLAENKKVVAIGECGLDYYRIDENNARLKEVQNKIFQSHIDLSLSLDKPLMLHIRPQKGTMDAYNDALDILESQAKISGGKLRGNVHFFVGDINVLKRFLDLGFTVSFTGVITFARDYDDVVKYAPLDMILSETDAPFVAPEPYRGKRNSPLYVTEVVKRIAQIREESEEDVKTALRNNAIRVFALEKFL